MTQRYSDGVPETGSGSNQKNKNPNPEKNWSQISSKTKELFATDTCQEKQNQFSLMEYYWAC